MSFVPVRVVEPDRVVNSQLRSLVERLVTSLEFRDCLGPADVALICETHAYLRNSFNVSNTDPAVPDPCDRDPL